MAIRSGGQSSGQRSNVRKPWMGYPLPIKLAFELPGSGSVEIAIGNAVIAGWTARDRAAVDHHIAELADLGVKPPSEVPLFYRVSAPLLTQDSSIEVLGTASSGEVEPVLLADGTGLYLGLGSDHTDRELEAYSVAMSKQVCAKPLAPLLWRYDEVRDHLDRIELRSWIRDDAGAGWVPYQEGVLGKIRPLPELIELSPFAAGPERLHPGTAIMCGTFGVLSGGVRPARHFRMQMHDPVLGRTIEHGYEARHLPVVA